MTKDGTFKKVVRRHAGVDWSAVHRSADGFSRASGRGCPTSRWLSACWPISGTVTASTPLRRRS